jgi:hypothetical protein
MGKKKKGFAALSPEEHKKICSMGGKARAAKKVGHFFTSETGKAARAKRDEASDE